MLEYSKTVNRVIDANINRAKEGLRVCEEISRFILDSHQLTSEFKKIRHEIDDIIKRPPSSLTDFIKERESRKDVGKNIYINELKKKRLSRHFLCKYTTGKGIHKSLRRIY